MTRIQKERFENVEDYDKVNGVFVLGKEHVEKSKSGINVLKTL
jgi:aspartate carbamoyltransferase catalytic subunit